MVSVLSAVGEHKPSNQPIRKVGCRNLRDLREDGIAHHDRGGVSWGLTLKSTLDPEGLQGLENGGRGEF